MDLRAAELSRREMNDKSSDRDRDNGSGSTLRIEIVSETTIEDWQYVHNRVIPDAPLTVQEIQERLDPSFLTVAYAGKALVGCATVRHALRGGNVTVITRVLPEYRRRGYGEEIYLDAMRVARGFGGEAIETVVLASNEGGARFALARGFVETDRYSIPGHQDTYITMRLS
jgi:GNAT superfamily N-acetyltransferase